MGGKCVVNQVRFGTFAVRTVETDMGHAIIHEDSGTTTISYYGDGFELMQKFSCGDEPWKTDAELLTGICETLGTGEAIPAWVTAELALKP